MYLCTFPKDYWKTRTTLASQSAFLPTCSEFPDTFKCTINDIVTLCIGYTLSGGRCWAWQGFIVFDSVYITSCKIIKCLKVTHFSDCSGPSNSLFLFHQRCMSMCLCVCVRAGKRLCVSGCLSFQSSVSMVLSCLGQTCGSVGHEPWVNFKLLPPGRRGRPRPCDQRRTCAGISSLLDAFHHLGLNDAVPFVWKPQQTHPLSAATDLQGFLSSQSPVQFTFVLLCCFYFELAPGNNLTLDCTSAPH